MQKSSSRSRSICFSYGRFATFCLPWFVYRSPLAILYLTYFSTQDLLYLTPESNQPSKLSEISRSTMKAIAIDDEPQALKVIQMLSEKIPFLNLEASFTDAMEALGYIQQHPVDLVFLDIRMPDISGLDWAKGLSSKPMIIFTTAYSEYAVESYELDAVDYLVKPIPFNRFFKAVNRASELMQHQQPAYTFVKSGHEYVRINFDQLLYLQGAANYVDFYTQEKRITVRMKLAEAMELLPDSFAQIHRSYLVNLALIERVHQNHVMIGEASISIGQSYREGFLEKLNQRGT